MDYNELYHYGVQGMKWGVRKDRQYGRKLRYTSPTRELYKSNAQMLALRTAASIIPGAAMVYNAWVISHNINYMRNTFDRTDYTAKEGPIEKLSELKKKRHPI